MTTTARAIGLRGNRTLNSCRFAVLVGSAAFVRRPRLLLRRSERGRARQRRPSVRFADAAGDGPLIVVARGADRHVRRRAVPPGVLGRGRTFVVVVVQSLLVRLRPDRLRSRRFPVRVQHRARIIADHHFVDQIPNFVAVTACIFA